MPIDGNGPAPRRLGIIAGGGDLPRRLAMAARARGGEPFLVALEGHCPSATVEGFEHAVVRLGAAGTVIDRLRQAGCADLVLAGPVRRPSLMELRPDARGMALLARIGYRMLGDDGLLSAVVAALEAEGFRVVKAESLLDDLLAPEGALGRHAPDEAARADIARGRAVLAALGPLDIGQAVVVQQGMVLGIEAAEGTDGLIARCAAYRRPGPGAVLVKMAKPGQSDRVDVPTIGTGTVAACAAAGMAGIAVGAGNTWVVDRAAVAAAADAAGLFVVGV
ncbi:MAG: UDP-2,3-diacylglucosamine diphosphatase LpxI [Thalassobaculales bacterium]